MAHHWLLLLLPLQLAGSVLVSMTVIAAALGLEVHITLLLLQQLLRIVFYFIIFLPELLEFLLLRSQRY